MALILFCCSTTFVAYFKVFRINRQHQQQVQGNQSSQNVGQLAINLAKYKRSVVSILFILALFSFCFLPVIFILAVIVRVGGHSRNFGGMLSIVSAIIFIFLVEPWPSPKEKE